MNAGEKLSIAVLAGGYSGEAVISIQSAETVMQHLDRDRFSPYLVHIDPDEWWVEYESSSKICRAIINRDDFTWKDLSDQTHKFSSIFIMVHGTPGEDGILQEYFENLGLPFSTGSSESVKTTFNKFKANNILRKAGILVADSVKIDKGQAINAGKLSDIVSRLGLPCFVKPNEGGSSLGVTRVESMDDLEPAINYAFQTNCLSVLIESILVGREFSVGVVPNSDGSNLVMPVTEIITENSFFDFEAKYEGASEEITPAHLSIESTDKIQHLAISAYSTLNCRGMVRIDFILIKNERPAVLEINSVPGFTKMSLLPQQLEHAGLSIKDLLTSILQITDLKQ